MIKRTNTMLLFLFIAFGAAAREPFFDDICSRAPHVAEFAPNWCDNDIDRCQWKGVSCRRDGSVYSVTLSDIALGIELPIRTAEISEVTLMRCGLFGDLSTLDAETLPNALRLDGNSLTGFLSSASIERMGTLTLSGNQLEGDIAAILCADGAAKLDILDLSNNALTGDLTACSGTTRFAKMRWFNVSHNAFSGRAPVPWRSINFDVSDNQFTALEDSTLEVFVLQAGDSGFPEMTLPKMLKCNVARNRFSGEPPAWLTLTAGVDINQKLDCAFVAALSK